MGESKRIVCGMPYGEYSEVVESTARACIGSPGLFDSIVDTKAHELQIGAFDRLVFRGHVRRRLDTLAIQGE